MINLMQRLYFDAIESGSCSEPLTEAELELVNDERVIDLTECLNALSGVENG